MAAARFSRFLHTSDVAHRYNIGCFGFLSGLRRTTMKVRIQVLRRGPSLSVRLQRAGWRVESESERALVVYHPEVRDAGEARERLNQLGMLTSAALRIDLPLLETPVETAVYSG
jgi:hypothetical protein